MLGTRHLTGLLLALCWYFPVQSVSDTLIALRVKAFVYQLLNDRKLPYAAMKVSVTDKRLKYCIWGRRMPKRTYRALALSGTHSCSEGASAASAQGRCCAGDLWQVRRI